MLNGIAPDKGFMLAGDWHGSSQQGLSVITSAHIRNIDVVFQVGDFGIWQDDKKYLNKLEHQLSNWDMHLFFIDGNHENFDMLEVKRINDDGTRFVREHITYVPRGHRWEWGGIKFLALGGAASIDKGSRVEGRSWWPQELITEDDVKKSIEGGEADVMICHDSPASAPNTITDDVAGQRWAAKFFGREHLDVCTEHRKTLQRVTDVVKPKALFHGHYHRGMGAVYHHHDENRTVGRVIGLDEGTGPFESHTYVFDFEKAKEDFESLNNIK